MSFSLTTEAIQTKDKTVTRSQGWSQLRVGDLIQPIEKGMGLKKGEKQVLIGKPIVILEITTDEIQAIDLADVRREGFPDMSVEEFIHMYCKANKVKPWDRCRRICFDYLEDLEGEGVAA